MSKIIIVEDDPMIQEIYQKKFSEAGFEVLVADSGKKVLNLAKENADIDVILLDLLMPKMSGFEVTEHLRNPEEGYNQNIKIIIFSNLSQKEDRDKAMKLGANGFIAKADYAPSELVAEVKRLAGNLNEQVKNGERIADEAKTDVEKDGKKKILFIEDEKVFTEMFGKELTDQGFNVSIEENGSWGVKKAMKEKFDLFLIGTVVQAMTGKEIVEKLKMEDETKDIPIIALSASVDHDDEDEGEMRNMGIEDYCIETEITPSELAEKVKKILK